MASSAHPLPAFIVGQRGSLLYGLTNKRFSIILCIVKLYFWCVWYMHLIHILTASTAPYIYKFSLHLTEACTWRNGIIQYTVYCRVYVPLHLLQPWQARFISKNSNYLWHKGVQYFQTLASNIDTKSKLVLQNSSVLFISDLGGFHLLKKILS